MASSVSSSAPDSAKRGLPLHTRIFIGLFAGLVLGLACNLLLPGDERVRWFVQNIAYPAGQIFLRLIFMVIIPLIFSALALGVADLGDVNRVGRIGLKTFLFTIVITGVSVLIGIALTNLVQPGIGIATSDRESLLNTLNANRQTVSGAISMAKESKTAIQTILDIIPRNPFVDMVGAFDPAYRGGGLLSVMFFALVFGAAIALSDRTRTQTLVGFLQGLNDVVMKIIDFAMRLAPYGVAGLMFSTTSQLGFQLIAVLSKYVLVVLGALAIHQFITYGLIVKFAAKRNPFEFFRDIQEVMLTAFSTSSSNATLPTSIRVTNEKLGVHPDITSFVLTIGSTANQNGSALFEGITVLFLAQFYGITLDFGQQLTVVLLSILAGVGTAGVPGASFPLLVVVMQSVGVPAEGIGIIIGVDRILDMSRTVVNVTGDIALATWVAASETDSPSRPPHLGGHFDAPSGAAIHTAIHPSVQPSKMAD
ncbi:MAG: dicarboxylate/amino acid:cation symporter [Rhizobacter sp.]|nr:dicarboxylate/amino acid:cation symporter [Chlorobiales bacterium]